MAAESLYSVIFSGQIQPGADLEQVKSALAARFRMPPEQVSRLFDGRTVTIRRDLSMAQAKGVSAVFEQAGARCELRLQVQPAPSKTTDGPVTEAAQPVGGLPDLALAQRPDGRGRRLLRRLTGVGALALPLLYPTVLALLALFALVCVARPMLEPRGFGLLSVADVLPALIAAGLLLWLARPMLGRSAAAASVDVAPGEAAELEALAERLADLIGAPAPARIAVDMSADVRARWRVPLLRPLRPELHLHIGLPLLAALDSRQLAGMLMQALGSAAPGHAPLLLQWLRDSLGWLRQLSDRPDPLVARLQRWAEGRVGPEAAAAAALQRLLRTPHRLAGMLAATGTAAAQRVLRRRELDGLDYQLQLAGAEATAVALRLSRALAHTAAGLYDELGQVDRRELLSGDLPGLVVALAAQRADQLASRVEEELNAPQRIACRLSDIERLQAANAAAEPLLDDRAPASRLLAYAELARRLSLESYRLLGIEVEPKQLVALTRARAALSVRQQRADALRDYFRGCLLPGVAVAPVGFVEALALEPAARVAQLQEAVAAVRYAVPELLDLAGRYPQAADALLAAEAAMAAARYRRDPEAEPELHRCKQVHAKYETLRLRYRELFGRRLGLALAEAVAQGADRQRLQAKVEPAITALNGLASLEPDLLTCRREITVARRLATTHGSGVKVPAHVFLTQISNVLHRLDRVHQRLASVRIEQGVLAEQLRGVLPPLPDSADAVMLEHHLDALDAALERIRGRVTGRLALLAAAAEAKHGIRVKLVG